MRHAVVAAMLALALPRVLHAQDSLPFRAGQWGALLSLGYGFNAVGVVHFRGPTRAWTLDASGSTSRGISRYTDTTTHEFTNDRQSLRLRLGTRSFHSVGPRVNRQLTFGLSGEVQHEAGNQPYRPVSWSLSGGLFMELGGEWLVSDHLGLGAAWVVTASYVYRRQTTSGSFPTASTTRIFGLDLGSAGVRGTIYF